MGIKYIFNPLSGEFDAVQDLTEYAKLAIETTQDNLYSNLIANSLLIPNQWYLITDYRGYAKVPNTSLAVYYGGSIFISDTEPVGTTYPVTSAMINSITDNTKTWTADAYVGYYVKITAGTGIGQERLILSNTTDTITTTTDWTITPDATSYYDIEMTEKILLRAATTSELAPDGYSISYTDENIVFTQNITPIIDTVQGTWEDQTSYGKNTISDVTTYGFTIDDLGYHWSNKPAGYGWYIEAYDMYGSQYYDYGEIYHQLYAYMDSSGNDIYSHQIKITSATTFHVELKGFLFSDLSAEDPYFYINVSDGTNEYNLTESDLDVLFTFNDNGDFVWLDDVTYPLDLTQLMANGGYIEMAYNTTSVLTTIDDDGLVSIPNQGVLYVSDRQIYNNYSVSPVDATNLYMEMPRPFALREAGTFSASFYDPVNDITITLNDAGEGLDWSWDGDTGVLTLLDGSGGAYTGLFDFQNVDYSLISQFSFNFEFQSFDLTRTGSSIYIEWYYVLREIYGMITKRYNSAYNLELPFDYRNRVIARYECLASDWTAGTYNAGDVVRYSGNIYACFKDGCTASPNDVTCWAFLFGEQYYYMMGSKDYSLHIRTSKNTNATATILYNPAKVRYYRMLDVQQLYNQSSKINSKVTCVNDDLDLFFPQDKIGQFYNNRIHCAAGNGSTVIGNWTDNDCTVSESLIGSMFQVKGQISNTIAVTLAQSNFNYMNGCYARYINRSNISYIEAVFLAGSMQASSFGYLSQVTFWYNNVNYNTVMYMFSCLYKGAFSNNLSAANFNQVSVGATCDQNVIVGTFEEIEMGNSFSQNCIIGQLRTTTSTSTFNGNWIRLGGSNTIASLQTSTITSFSNNNTPSINYSYITAGICSNNTGTGSGSFRYNKGETFQSNVFANGATSLDIRNNNVNEISSNTFNTQGGASYNNGNKISGCTFRANSQVTYNTIFNQLLNCTFGDTGITRYFSYNVLYGVESSTFQYSFQESFSMNTISSYTQPSSGVSANFIRHGNAAARMGIGVSLMENITSVMTLYGALATRYLAASGNNTLNANHSVMYCTSSPNTQTLPAANTCAGRQYYIIHGGASTTTIARTGTDTINGVAGSYVLRLPLESVLLVSDGVSNWSILSTHKPTALTATRVPFVDANGNLVDDADMTFATDTLTVTKVRANNGFNFNGTAGVTDTNTGLISDIDVQGGIITSITKVAKASAETPLNTSYTTGDLDTEAEIISAINSTNTTINSLITKLQALGLLN